MQRRIIREIELIARSVRRVKMRNDHIIARHLLDGDAELLDGLRKTWLRDEHAALRQHESRVEVGPESEAQRQSELPIACRLAGEVLHIFDAVDLLIERRRHSLADYVGR